MRRSLSVVYGAVFLLAVTVRAVPVLTGGGLGFYGRYDDAVYYAASDALAFGRIPYRDFVLVHPPGSTLALLPFAALGRVAGDLAGMETARVAFMVVGSLNAVLVAAVASRWGRSAAVIGGLLYACSWAATYTEQTTMLEPLAGTATLVALWLLLRDDRGPRAELLAGAALGAACTFKIWYAAPLAAVVATYLLMRRPATAIRLSAGASAALALVLGPFAALAGKSFWRMVVDDQLSRGVGGASRAMRIPSAILTQHMAHRHAVDAWTVSAIALAVLVAAAAACVRDRHARVVVVVLAVDALVLQLSPTFFRHYAVLAVAPGALVFAIGTSLMPRPALRRALTAALIAAAGVGGLLTAAKPTGSAFPSELAASAPAGCVTADDPAGLIAMDRLSSDLENGCYVPVDVTGTTLDTMRPTMARDSRTDNAAFQSFLRSYLLDSSAFVLIRPDSDGNDQTTLQALYARPVLRHRGDVLLRAGLGATRSLRPGPAIAPGSGSSPPGGSRPGSRAD